MSLVYHCFPGHKGIYTVESLFNYTAVKVMLQDGGYRMMRLLMST